MDSNLLHDRRKNKTARYKIGFVVVYILQKYPNRESKERLGGNETKCKNILIECT